MKLVVESRHFDNQSSVVRMDGELQLSHYSVVSLLHQLLLEQISHQIQQDDAVRRFN